MNARDDSLPVTRQPIDFDANLAYHLAVVSNLLNTSVSRNIVERFGIGLTTWRVLAMMGACAPMYAKEISRSTGIDKATVSRAVNQMIADGLVERRPEPRDRRYTRLCLTPRGTALHDRIAPVAKRFYAHFESVLDADELAMLLTLLKKVRVRADMVRADDALQNLLEGIA